MEKESDIDDIFSYRSAAEHELQEVLSKSSTANFSVEKSRQDGQSFDKSRGWLNWLSRGMLGAGGTDDSSQFSGVVSDEDVQDIYEATQFYSPVLSDADTNDKTYTRAIEFNIDEVSAKIWSMDTISKTRELKKGGAEYDNIIQSTADLQSLSIISLPFKAQNEDRKMSMPFLMAFNSTKGGGPRPTLIEKVVKVKLLKSLKIPPIPPANPSFVIDVMVEVLVPFVIWRIVGSCGNQLLAGRYCRPPSVAAVSRPLSHSDLSLTSFFPRMVVCSRRRRGFNSTGAVAASSVRPPIVPPLSRSSHLLLEPDCLGAAGDFPLESAKELEAKVKALKALVADLNKRVKDLKIKENAVPRGSFLKTSGSAGAASSSNSDKDNCNIEIEKESTKFQKRQRRDFTRRMLVGLRQFDNFPFPPNAAMNNVWAALAPRSGESPLSTSHLKKYSQEGKHRNGKPSFVHATLALSVADVDHGGAKEIYSKGYSDVKFSEVVGRRRNGFHNRSKEGQPDFRNGSRKGCYTIFIENLPEKIHWKRLGSIFGSHDSDSLRSVKDDKLETLAEWFSKVETWSESLVVESRIVWLVCEDLIEAVVKVNNGLIDGRRVAVRVAKYQKSTNGKNLSGPDEVGIKRKEVVQTKNSDGKSKLYNKFHDGSSYRDKLMGNSSSSARAVNTSEKQCDEEGILRERIAQEVRVISKERTVLSGQKSLTGGVASTVPRINEAEVQRFDNSVQLEKDKMEIWELSTLQILSGPKKELIGQIGDIGRFRSVGSLSSNVNCTGGLDDLRIFRQGGKKAFMEKAQAVVEGEKSRAVRNIIEGRKPSLLFIQEAKFEIIKLSLRRRLGGNFLNRFVVSPTIELAGGFNALG
ncbi:hypothetical protein F3Y22_tig00000340pilonHSYRG01421 [Hibiscus syriacus]|uniref:BES1/BZR1 plant transcription factor N-terminal domain-containing protein n=1 Tax=Hibiscus syriacus TaxID=106335 RepID=A0A6A3D299_HIBSY|nr:hypothetical protein F3Y22_tig00000340pilonHSYRG01421 [Hibiscus syriacus]